MRVFALSDIHIDYHENEQWLSRLSSMDYQEVGVDVEYLLRPGKTVELADSFFSPIETQQLLALPPEKQNDRFFDLWTLKEAYIKACGMGSLKGIQDVTLFTGGDKPHPYLLGETSFVVAGFIPAY